MIGPTNYIEGLVHYNLWDSMAGRVQKRLLFSAEPYSGVFICLFEGQLRRSGGLFVYWNRLKALSGASVWVELYIF